ncbi:MAG: flavodoxin family protein [Bacteroidetes bacterium]|nr:MAG: flavodoxin family protein [Bacteroidota bacterium]
MTKKILIINGHPRKDSLNYTMAEAYRKGAENTGAKVKTLNIIDLNFNEFGTVFKDSEPIEDVKKAQELISWADHTVWVYPTWWYTIPALLKAFMEQTLLSGFAFKYLKSDKVIKWDKHLKGKSARIISTMDAPPWYYKLFVRDPGFKTMKSSLGFCGINPVKRSYFGSVKVSTDEQITAWIKDVEKLGRNLK